MVSKGCLPPEALNYPASERNKPHILECLKKYIISLSADESGNRPIQTLLEVASGSGQHTAHFAPHFPFVIFQPTEFDPRLLKSIDSYRNHYELQNVKEATVLDVTQPATLWLNGSIKQSSIDYVLCVNMIHISPWACTKGLFDGAAQVLRPGGHLFMYGPFAVDGQITPQSNVDFDRSLRAHNPNWGLRDLTRQLAPLAAGVGLKLLSTYDLPANNKFLAWVKQMSPLLKNL